MSFSSNVSDQNARNLSDKLEPSFVKISVDQPNVHAVAHHHGRVQYQWSFWRYRFSNTYDDPASIPNRRF